MLLRIRDVGHALNPQRVLCVKGCSNCN